MLPCTSRTDKWRWRALRYDVGPGVSDKPYRDLVLGGWPTKCDDDLFSEFPSFSPELAEFGECMAGEIPAGGARSPRRGSTLVWIDASQKYGSKFAPTTGKALVTVVVLLPVLGPPDSSSGKRLPGGCDSRGSLTVDIQSLMASSKGRAPISMGREGGTGWRQDPFWCGAVESRPEAADDASSSCCRARGPLDVRQLRPGFE